jgi:very-short-patch-repair endonuclease
MQISKLTDQILANIIELANKEYSHTAISKELGITRQNVDLWIKKYNIPTVGNGGIIPENHKIFIEELKLTGSPNKAAAKVNFGSNGSHLIKKYNLQEYVNERGVDKILSLEEAQSRVPVNNGKVLGFKDGKYEIQTVDGFIYYKTSAKLCQGDPRHKSGRIIPIEEVEKELKEAGYTLIRESYTTKANNFKAIHDKCGQTRENNFYNFFEQGCRTCRSIEISKAKQIVKIKALDVKEISSTIKVNMEKPHLVMPKEKHLLTIKQEIACPKIEDKTIYSNYLTEDNLELCLNEIFKCKFIRNKSFNKTCRYRPDFRNDNLKLIIEFDGPFHYTQAKTIITDEKKNQIYKNFGYRIIRIPYFIQLNKETILNIFGIKVDCDCLFPHGFIDPKTVLPVDFCQLGIERFKKDLEIFNWAKIGIIESLIKRPEMKIDSRLVIPESLSFLLNEL